MAFAQIARMKDGSMELHPDNASAIKSDTSICRTTHLHSAVYPHTYTLVSVTLIVEAESIRFPFTIKGVVLSIPGVTNKSHRYSLCIYLIVCTMQGVVAD
jgi:hypothetical protein